MTSSGVSRPTVRFEGTWVVGAALGVALIETLVVAVSRDLDAGLLELVRMTAQTSMVWFALAFVATPAVSLVPGRTSKWLLRNRRYLGLAMAVSHGVHLLAIMILAARVGSAFWSAMAPTTLIGGGLGYVFLAAMVATSSTRAQEWLGRRRWRVLHSTGMWFFWSIFTFTYAGQLGQRASAGIAIVAMLGLALSRVVMAVHRARRGRLRRAAAR